MPDWIITALGLAVGAAIASAFPLRRRKPFRPVLIDQAWEARDIAEPARNLQRRGIYAVKRRAHDAYQAGYRQGRQEMRDEAVQAAEQHHDYYCLLRDMTPYLWRAWSPADRIRNIQIDPKGKRS